MPLDFKKLLCARFFFTFAVQMQAVILGWRIYDLLKDPLSLGLIGLAEAVPALGLALYAGFLIDRLRPLVVYRRVLFVSLLSGVIVLMEHIWADDLSIFQQAGLLYSAAFLTGLARSFAQPALYSAVPRIVGSALLMKASAMSSSVMQVARVAGPAFGGLIFGFLGAIVSSSVVCVCLIISLLLLGLMKIQLPAPTPVLGEHETVKDEFLAGARFVFRHPILFPAMTLDMVSVLFGGVTALLPIFAEDILLVGPKGLGILRGAPAIGAALTSFYMSKRQLPEQAGRWLLSAIAGFGCCILLFAMSRNFLLSLFVLALSGVFDSISMLIRSTAVQVMSPDHMRGKISAVNSIFIGSSNELGELESGLAARLLGTVPAVYFGGVVCLLSVFISARLAPHLRQLNLNEIMRSRSIQ